MRDGVQAIALARHSVELAPNDANLLGTLAAAYAEAGQFPQAVQAGEQAVHLAVAVGNRELAKQIQARLELFKNGKPYHQASSQ